MDLRSERDARTEWFSFPLSRTDIRIYIDIHTISSCFLCVCCLRVSMCVLKKTGDAAKGNGKAVSRSDCTGERKNAVYAPHHIYILLNPSDDSCMKRECSSYIFFKLCFFFKRRWIMNLLLFSLRDFLIVILAVSFSPSCEFFTHFTTVSPKNVSLVTLRECQLKETSHNNYECVIRTIFELFSLNF